MELWIILIVAVIVLMAPVHLALFLAMTRGSHPAAKMAFLASVLIEGLLLAGILVWQFVLK